MFNDRRARTRSYQIIEEIATQARRIGRVHAHSQFDIVGFIIGELQIKIYPDLEIIFFEKGEYAVPAFVRTRSGSKIKTLYVETNTWLDAKSNIDRARFILAHEIGHIIMHSHNELAFCGSTPSVIGDLQPEDRAEPQADLFGDLFLVPESMLGGFSCAEDIADYFNVPMDCATRRFDHITDKQRRQRKSLYEGEACPECANFTLVRNGTCLKCDTCGSTTGCS